MTPETEGGFAAADGTRLHMREWVASDPTARLLLIHGLTEHSGRYERTGRDLAGYRISTFAFDLRGHGRSGGRRGDAPGMTALVDDVVRFRHEIDARSDTGLPLFLLGHSLGGLIALRCLLEPGLAFAGGIIIAPWLGLASAPRWKVAVGRAVAPILPALPVPAGIDPEDLSRDPAVVRSWRNDSHVQRWITPRLFLAVEDAIAHVFANAGRLPPPLLLILSGQDRIVDTERSRELVRQLPPGDFQMHVEAASRHEILNDLDRDQAIERIVGWIRRRSARSGGHPAPESRGEARA